MYNTEQFINKVKKTHGDKYDYSLIEYKSSRNKIEIICPKHGKFNQIAAKHLSGSGCPKCGGSNKKQKIEFIEECKKIHGDKYDYSLIEYKSSRDKIDIICSKHGKFKQRAYNHIKGSGCPKCYLESKNKTNEEFIIESNRIHEGFYDYSIVDYKKNDKKVKIICPLHGEFKQKPIFHLRGQGCPKCANENKKLTRVEFILNSKRVHGNFYDYSKSNYVNNYTKVEIICPIHGSFYQSPNFHMLGQGCPTCKKSKMEKYISTFLKENKIKFKPQKTFKKCKNINLLPFDFFLVDYNMCIEYNGKQHYEAIEYFGGEETLKYIQHNDNIKREFCEKNNIKYLEIKYDDDVEKTIKSNLNI